MTEIGVGVQHVVQLLAAAFFTLVRWCLQPSNRKQRAPTLSPLNFSTFFAANVMDDLSLHSSSVPRSGEFWVSFTISLETSSPFPRMWWLLQRSLFSPSGGLCCVTATFNFCKPTACLPVPKTGNVFFFFCWFSNRDWTLGGGNGWKYLSAKHWVPFAQVCLLTFK